MTMADLSMKVDVAARLHEVIVKRFGRVEEELMTSGIVDSMQVVELALMLEESFGLPPDSFTLEDMRTVTSLRRRIDVVRRTLQARSAT
jgi:acyl carrier protein